MPAALLNDINNYYNSIVDRRDVEAKQRFAILARTFMRQCGEFVRVVDMTKPLPTDAVISEILVILCGKYVIAQGFHFASFFLQCSPNIYTCKGCGEIIPEPAGFHFYPKSVHTFIEHTRNSNCMIVNLCDSLGEFDPFNYRRPIDRLPQDVRCLQYMPTQESGDEDEQDN